MKPLHIATSPLTARIFVGHILKSGVAWAANKQDVTGQACGAVCEHVMANGGTVEVTLNGKPKFEITVRDVESAVDQPASDLPDISPTAGMPLGERIAHVGGRVTEEGLVEFGSPMAVDALILHVLRDIKPAQSVPNRITPEQAPAEIREYAPIAAEGYADGWNACVKAMAAGKP